MNALVFPVVALAEDNLDDMKLSVMVRCMLLEQNPKGLAGYEKAKELFTLNEGTKAHRSLKRH